MRALQLILMATLFANPALGQTRRVFELDAGNGSVWLEGSFTLGSFSCTATAVVATIDVDVTNGDRPVAASLSLPTRGLDCGNRAMERDLHRAVRADTYPEIRYAFDTADVSVVGDFVTIGGRLTLAGVTRELVVSGRYTRGSGALAARGSATFRMTEFDVQPPTALMGLIRARDRIIVRFDLRMTESGLATARLGNLAAGALR